MKKIYLFDLDGVIINSQVFTYGIEEEYGINKNFGLNMKAGNKFGLKSILYKT